MHACGGEESILLGNTGDKGQEGNICCLACLCEVPGVSLKVPREPQEITDETFGCEQGHDFSSWKLTFCKVIHNFILGFA